MVVHRQDHSMDEGFDYDLFYLLQPHYLKDSGYEEHMLYHLSTYGVEDIEGVMNDFRQGHESSEYSFEKFDRIFDEIIPSIGFFLIISWKGSEDDQAIYVAKYFGTYIIYDYADGDGYAGPFLTMRTMLSYKGFDFIKNQDLNFHSDRLSRSELEFVVKQMLNEIYDWEVVINEQLYSYIGGMLCSLTHNSI